MYSADKYIQYTVLLRTTFGGRGCIVQISIYNIRSSYAQHVATIIAAYTAFRLPPLLIFKNLKNAPKGKFPPGMAVLGSKCGSITAGFFEHTFSPKVLARRPGGYFQAGNTLLVMDAATCHTRSE